MEHYVPSVVAFRKRPPIQADGHKFASSYFGWAFVEKRPVLSKGGLHLPLTEGGLHRFEPPQTSSGCKPATSRDARGGSLRGPQKVFAKLHGNWGNESAQGLRGELAGSAGADMRLANYVDVVPELCEVCRAS